MKRLSILGSTGSIGTQTLELVKEHPTEFKVTALSCQNNIELLKKQIKEFKPEIVAVYDKEKADQIKDVEVVTGMDGLKKIVAHADLVVNALVGSIGVLPTVEAIIHKKQVALANKETLVSAGSIIMKAAKKNEVNILPIDSEHSAIFQCLQGEDTHSLNSITLTCSGGPFKDKSRDELKKVTLSDALKHPTWNMGDKITIDSATLMNKGFEVIEAHWLYHLPIEQIKVVLHPESIVHSMVEFNDRSVKAQLGMPSMKIPIQYALAYPRRLPNIALPQLDITRIKKLSFTQPDLSLFPCLQYAYEAGNIGGTLPAVMNAANEVAVRGFLAEKISFLDIPKLVKMAMDNHKLIKQPSLDEIMDVDRKIKAETEDKMDEK